LGSKYSARARRSFALFSIDRKRLLGRMTVEFTIASNLGVGIDLTESPPALRRDGAILISTN